MYILIEVKVSDRRKYLIWKVFVLNVIFRKNMSKNNSKSLASLRQKLRKYNKDFEEELAKFRENPDLGDEDEEQPKGDEVTWN